MSKASLYLILSSFITLFCYYWFSFGLEIIIAILNLSLTVTRLAYIKGGFIVGFFIFINCWLYFSDKINILKAEIQNIKGNRDIPEIIKIEEEKWAIKKEKEQAKLAEQIKQGEYSLTLSLDTLRKVVSDLQKDKLTLRIQHPNLQISDGLKMWTIKPSTTTKKPVQALFDDLFAFEDCINRRVDKKEFINALKAIPTNFVEVLFFKNERSIEFRQPNGAARATIIAKN